MTYIPLHNHTHYSLLLGLSKPKDIAERCLQLGATACAITDIGTISGNIAFYKEMINNNIKPILGCDLYIQDKKTQQISRLVLICKNLDAWQNLIKIVSLSNSKEFFDNKPQIDLESLAQYTISKDFICITGFYNSTLWNEITSDNELKYDWEQRTKLHIEELNSIFGQENVFVEIQLFDNTYNQKQIFEQIREICKINNFNRVAGIESYYCEASDSVDQRILLCSNMKTTLPEISKKILNNTETGFNHFFNSDMYHILNNETVQSLYDTTEIDNTVNICNMCEMINPLNKPVLPQFPYPSEFNNESEYLRQLCREGWKQKIEKYIDKSYHHKYVDRIKYELEVLENAGLSSYFLIVRDILQFVRDNGWLPGPGRGSAAGCLVSYLIGITNIDPIKYDLLFERFYNSGRNTKDRISMPDIDVDVPITQRDTIIQYIKNKYGQDKVSQMITFNTLKGRGALKEVLRVYDNISFEEMNAITKNIPDEAKIADELQEIKEEEGEASIIKWSLENNPEKFKEWCEIDEDGQLKGPLAKRFEQAIRIEGTKYNQSKHAAGIAIAAKPLYEICPMVFDTKTNQNMAGLEMNDLDALGVIKFDILGIALLDKIMFVNQLINKE